MRKAEQRGEALPVAICLGVDPMLSFMASTPIAYDQSEYKYTAAINGIPMELAKTTTGFLDVPAGAEFVLEGEILPRVRVCEGPFGEFPGSYSGARKQVVIKIKRVTHRRDPIFENLYLGRPWTEIDTLLGLNTCIPIYKQMRETMPEVKAVNALYQHGLTVIIAMESRWAATPSPWPSGPRPRPTASLRQETSSWWTPTWTLRLVQVMWAMSPGCAARRTSSSSPTPRACRSIRGPSLREWAARSSSTAPRRWPRTQDARREDGGPMPEALAFQKQLTAMHQALAGTR
jgi:hypothetical protein